MSNRAYYNEIDPYCVQWICNLGADGHIAKGWVDERSVAAVQSGDLRRFGQCHFFAGIAAWSYALRCAGWPDSREVWTGSCPCQPFSCAGKRKGTADARHLWPEWFRLIKECLPVTIFGEQVGDKDGIAWFDTVQTDLESCGYTVGAVVAPAAGFGAPHQRHRIYFVAHSGRIGWETWCASEPKHASGAALSYDGSGQGSTADPKNTDGRRKQQTIGARQRRPRPSRGGELGNAISARLAGWSGEHRNDGAEFETLERASSSVVTPGPVNGFWRDAEWIPCTDGKERAAKPGTFPLAYDASARVGRLRAYGNAIVAAQATEFIRAFMEHEHLTA